MSVIAKYTLPTITGTHDNFVLLMRYDDFSQDALSQINDGGGNLRFYADQDATTPLPCEVVKFDKTAQEAQVYVKLSSAFTGADVYIGTDGTNQPLVTDPLGRNAVWSDYHIASHLSSLDDSTGNLTWTEVNNGSGVVGDPSGIIGDGYSTGDPANYLYTDNQPFTPTDEFTMSIWVRLGGELTSHTNLFSFSDLSSNFSNFAISVIRKSSSNPDHQICLYTREISSSRDNLVLLDGSVDSGKYAFINVRAYSGSSEMTVIFDGVTYTDSSTRNLAGSNADTIGINRLRNNVGGDWVIDEPRITKNGLGILHSDERLETVYANRTATGSWGVMTDIESAPAQEFTSNAALTLDELSISATMASTAPSFESYAHISLDEPQFQSALSTTAPEFISSAHIELEQPSFQSSAESTVPQFSSSASITLEPISFSVYMGSAQTIASTANLYINELEFSSTAQSTKPEFTSSAHIETEIEFASTLSSTLPQFVSYAALQIDDVSFATIEPIPQLESINIPDGAVVVYEAKNNVVTYTPKNSVIIRG